ncbi:MAG: glycosyltransferase family 4 protein [Candidatus Omnitrophota bacterium]|jgi:glycosyltransferase involved in cell wall biosynthesis
MKVLLLTTHLNTGGITSYLFTLSRRLKGLGVSVAIASSGGGRQEEFAALGVSLVTLNVQIKSDLDPRLYAAVIKLRRIIHKESIDIVHAQTRVTQVMGTLLSKMTPAVYCSTCHGFFKPRWSRKIFPGWGKAVVAISPAVQQHLMNDFHVAEERIAFIPNGLELDEFPLKSRDEKRALRRAWRLPDGPLLGIIARLSDVKGHAVLIDAMPAVLARFPGVRLLIVGEGKMGLELKRQVARLGLEQRVIFLPVVNRTSEILPLLDIFVLPSLQEGLGLSAMEAQAAGLPVIASRVGGLISLIEDGRTGRLVEPRNSGQLSGAILDLLEHPENARDMGRRARVFIEQEYSAERMARDTVKMYERILTA